MSMKLSLFPGEGKGYPLQYSGLEKSVAYTVMVVGFTFSEFTLKRVTYLKC